MSEHASYYPYWNRIVIGAGIVAAIVVVELAAIVWALWRE